MLFMLSGGKGRFDLLQLLKMINSIVYIVLVIQGRCNLNPVILATMSSLYFNVFCDQ